MLTRAVLRSKQYFRELPEPLLTFELYDGFSTSMATGDAAEKIFRLQGLVDQLPEVNRVTLQYLMLFLNRVADFQQYNKMNGHNLAIVFGPNLLRPENPMSMLGLNYASVHAMIDHYKEIFEIEDEVAGEYEDGESDDDDDDLMRGMDTAPGTPAVRTTICTVFCFVATDSLFASLSLRVSAGRLAPRARAARRRRVR